MSPAAKKPRVSTAAAAAATQTDGCRRRRGAAPRRGPSTTGPVWPLPRVHTVLAGSPAPGTPSPPACRPTRLPTHPPKPFAQYDVARRVRHRRPTANAKRAGCETRVPFCTAWCLRRWCSCPKSPSGTCRGRGHTMHTERAVGQATGHRLVARTLLLHACGHAHTARAGT